MSEIVIKGIKIGALVVGTIASVASSYIAGKELDMKISKKVSEEFLKREV